MQRLPERKVDDVEVVLIEKESIRVQIFVPFLEEQCYSTKVERRGVGEHKEHVAESELEGFTSSVEIHVRFVVPRGVVR